jgi:hypothetical protein
LPVPSKWQRIDMRWILRGTASSGTPVSRALAGEQFAAQSPSVVNSTSASPLLTSGWLEAACAMSRRGSGRQLFDHLQADHLAGDLGETLDPADDPEEAVVV